MTRGEIEGQVQAAPAAPATSSGDATRGEIGARLQDLHLAAGHGGERGIVCSGGDSGAQGGVHREWDFGQVRLDGEGVADHADVGAQAAELDGVDGRDAVLRDEPAREVERAERGLFEHGSAATGANRLEDGCEFPAGRSGDTVGNGQIAALLRIGIVAIVGVFGENDRAVEAIGPLGDGLDDGLRLGRAQGTIDEVVLHVDDDEVRVWHGEGSFQRWSLLIGRFLTSAYCRVRSLWHKTTLPLAYLPDSLARWANRLPRCLR